ncbi:hypothetical protein vBBceSLY1_00057 [Bacillus phage vB_BceS_LY1]|uniref:Uncharacterized protein n=1 Tax=Bacillus phage vB_BceS_LY1 TaxID=2950459 RepID=A0AAE9LUW2_9CAUD|nr:hypothetical protein vBBceSLY1_00057 [Bacillus phage vB_BceS_LY1]
MHSNCEANLKRQAPKSSKQWKEQPAKTTVAEDYYSFMVLTEQVVGQDGSYKYKTFLKTK